MAAGLKINEDEPLEQFYDNFIRVGENGHEITPLQTTRNPESQRVAVTDNWESRITMMEISLGRTLRIPEDETPHHAPGLFGAFPLLKSEDLKSNSFVRKDGLVIPIFQREALALTFYEVGISDVFAVRVSSGSVKTVSGSFSECRENDQKQDYVVVPFQSRFDGFRDKTGLVKQFVAMPLGMGYTAEAQITDHELFGGIQLEIAPKFKGHETFTGYSDDSQSKTPRELGLLPGSTIRVGGVDVRRRGHLFRFPVDLDILGPEKLFPDTKNARPAFTHELLGEEIFCQPGDVLQTLTTVMSISLQLLFRPLDEFVIIYLRNYKPSWGLNCLGEYSIAEISPFTCLKSLSDSMRKKFKLDKIVFFHGSTELQLSFSYSPLQQFIKSDIPLTCQTYIRQRRERNIKGGIPPPRFATVVQLTDKSTYYTTTSGWDLGLSAGSRLWQDIVPDPHPRSWNWNKSRIVTVQLINSVVFERVTGIPAPPCPISYKDYVNARLPFYHTVSTGSIDGNSILSTLKIVGEMDDGRGVLTCTSMRWGLLPTCYVICELNLVDSM